MKNEIRPVEPLLKVFRIAPFQSFQFQNQEQFYAKNKKKALKEEIRKAGQEELQARKKSPEGDVGERVDYKV